MPADDKALSLQAAELAKEPCVEQYGGKRQAGNKTCPETVRAITLARQEGHTQYIA